MNLYMLHIQKIDYSLAIEKYNQYLSSKELGKKSKKLNQLHVLGRLILYHGLTSDFNLNYKDILIKKNIFGKPYLQDHKIYFNISYSNDWVICCISESEVGVDIEKIQDIDKKFIKYISNKSDSWIENHAQCQLKNYFFLDWCLRESFVKYMGTGLSYDIKQLDFVINDKITLYINNRKINNILFKSLDIINGYKLAIAMKKNEKINFIHLKKDFLDNIK